MDYKLYETVIIAENVGTTSLFNKTIQLNQNAEMVDVECQVFLNDQTQQPLIGFIRSNLVPQADLVMFNNNMPTTHNLNKHRIDGVYNFEFFETEGVPEIQDKILIMTLKFYS